MCCFVGKLYRFVDDHRNKRHRCRRRRVLRSPVLHVQTVINY